MKMKIPELFHWCHSDAFKVNFEQMSHIFSGVSITNFKQVNASWE